MTRFEKYEQARSKYDPSARSIFDSAFAGSAQVLLNDAQTDEALNTADIVVAAELSLQSKFKQFVDRDDIRAHVAGDCICNSCMDEFARGNDLTGDRITFARDYPLGASCQCPDCRERRESNAKLLQEPDTASEPEVRF